MVGSLIIFAVAVALVTTYMIAANRMLRSDEHWNENGAELSPRSVIVRARLKRK